MERYIERIARVCHQVNKAYCEAIGDFTQVNWEEAPDWQREPACNTVKFLLDNPDASVGATHEIWVEKKIEEGWRYGKEKEAGKKEHPCLVPFAELPPEQRVKDHLFHAVVRSLESWIKDECWGEQSPGMKMAEAMVDLV